VYALAVDTETTGLNWADGDYPFIATASDFDRDYLFQLAHHPDDKLDTDECDAHLDALRVALRGADALIFHNAPFDIHMLVSYGVLELEELLAKKIWDTSILSRLVVDTWDHRLKSLGVKLIDSEAGESENVIKDLMVTMGITRKRDQKDVGAGAYYEVWRAHREQMETYALADTRLTYDLYHVLYAMATDSQLRCWEIEQSVQPALIRMESRGVKVDVPRVSAISDRLEASELTHLETLARLNGEPFEPGSNSQLLAFLEKQGVVLSVKTPDGHISTAQWALEKHENIPAVRAILDYRTTNKVLTTYARPLLDRDIVHASFYQCGARTGRMSCARPNLQNIPARKEEGAQMRGVFVPRPGMVFIDADYSSIELRLLAYYSNSDPLWEVINTGDPFLWLGAQVYGTEEQDKWPVSRQSLKNGFYALTYGAGGPRLAQTIGGGMTSAEGRELASRMRRALGAPYSQLLSRLKTKVQSSGYVTTLAGRTQWVSRDKSYVALNALIQGSAADIMKVGLEQAEINLRLYDGYPLLVVHDEVLAEVPKDHAGEALAAMQLALESAADLAPGGLLTLNTSGVICPNNWSEAK
jgi:DNA polymerase-1